jgi:nicotinamide-nucleotide amidase
MSIPASARRLARLLKATNRKVVFAESCTGGLVSGALTAIPGISEHHCGGVVVYRNDSKIAFLNIPPKLLDRVGPVSVEVASLMAQNVLAKTPEANIAGSVTGHLGPGAPRQLDGLVFVAIARRGDNRRSSPQTKVHKLRCKAGDTRLRRQRWVVEQVLDLLASELNAASRNDNDE